MMKRTIVAMILMGCGVEPSSPPAVQPHDIREQSGTRLKIEWWETADGVQQFRGVYDNVLGVECSFRRMGDGAFACLPEHGEVAGAARATLDRQQVDLDIVGTSLCSDDGFVQPFGFYDTARATECSPQPLPDAGTFVCSPVGAAARATDPELALVSDSDDGHRLEAQYFAREDGLRQHVASFFDSMLATSCSVRAPSVSSTALCLPPLTIGESVERPITAYVAAIPTRDP